MRPAERISPPSAIATSQKSRWMSRPIDLIALLLGDLTGGEQVDNDSDGFVLGAQPGGSQGRPLKSRARSPSRRNGLSSLRSPESPCPSQQTVGPDPDVSFREPVSYPEKKQRARQCTSLFEEEPPATIAAGWATRSCSG